MPPQNKISSNPRSSSSGLKSRARADQLLAATLGVILIVASVLLQEYVLVPRRKVLVKESETSLRSLAVTFPRLTLGGFRGLLATALWIQAENDKNDRKWVELETKYDIIGSLQPYFISVYVYHAWNQAYNLSAQWHDQDTKYKWVLDGLAYLYKGEDYNPKTPDLLVEQGHMYFMKLGGSFERLFYRAHWRYDISRFYEYNDSSAKKEGVKYDALKLVHDFVMRVSPENRDAATRTKDPLELQKLRLFHTAELPDPSGKTTRMGYGVSILDPYLFGPEPMKFRYGLSPFYFAYVEYKRTIAAGHPSTTSMKVVDSWPAMSLRLWCRDDMVYAQDTVLALFGPGGIIEQPDPSSDVIDFINNKEAEVKDCYRNIGMIAPKSLDQFGQYLLIHPDNKAIHQKHIMETKSYLVMSKAENALIDALITWQAAGRKMTPDVRAAFLAALPLYDDSIAACSAWVDVMYPVKQGQPYPADRLDSEQYVNALRARKQGIEKLLSASPTEKPDLSFLKEQTAER